MGWAERGLKVGRAASGQECDEGCGVILYNLGMLHEVDKRDYNVFVFIWMLKVAEMVADFMLVFTSFNV